jgi:hypothetical protein
MRSFGIAARVGGEGGENHLDRGERGVGAAVEVRNHLRAGENVRTPDHVVQTRNARTGGTTAAAILGPVTVSP